MTIEQLRKQKKLLGKNISAVKKFYQDYVNVYIKQKKQKSMLITAASKESYRMYKLYLPDKILPIKNERRYISLINEFLKFLAKKIAEGFAFEIPSRLGTIYVRGKKIEMEKREDGQIKGGVVNWQATHKLWAEDEEAKKKYILVYYNPIFNPIRYKFVWRVKGNHIANKRFYEFRPSSYMRGILKSKIEKGETSKYIME